MNKIFVSFDYDNDARLKDLLIGQARNPASPFEIADWSVKRSSIGWRVDARRRITRCDQVIVLCGRSTDTASGVSAEVGIAREVGTPYFLLAGYTDAVRPLAASPMDPVYNWTWENLLRLTRGGR